MKILFAKYIILLIVFVLFLLFIRRFRSTSSENIVKIKEEIGRIDKSKWINYFVPDYDIEQKVKKYRKHKKKDKSKKEDLRKTTLRAGAKRSNNKHEEKVRDVLEEYFDDYFPSCRPKFLRNPETGRSLELDGYNPRLNLAFEYQGIQHRQFTPKFHPDQEAFEKQKFRDRIKKETLAKLEIDLLEIPDQIKYENLEIYVKKWLHEHKFGPKHGK